MTSTIMRNSQLPDAWLRDACQRNPVQALDDRFLSGPVRLAFPSVFEAKENKRDDGKSVHLYEATLLFPPIADLTIPWNGASQMAATKWPKNIVNGQLVGVGLPFTSQDDKSVKYEGFTPGGWKLSARSKFQPRVIDAATGQEITDPKRIYPGVWAIVDFNFYPTETKGNRVNTSLNVIYIFADDTNLGGGGHDPSKGLAQVQAMAPIMAPPVTVTPAPAPGQPITTVYSGYPAQPPQGAQTYHNAPNVAPPPAAPAYAPPAAQGYAAPAQTYHNAPNVAPPPAAPAYAPPVAQGYAAPAQSYAPVVETEEQRMLREAGLA